MKKLSITKMTDTIIAKRKEQKLTQAQLAEMTGINRGMISRLESSDYTPSIPATTVTSCPNLIKLLVRFSHIVSAPARSSNGIICIIFIYYILIVM